MSIPANGWAIKDGMSLRPCACGSWIQHWMSFSGQFWPPKCSVAGCCNAPSVGGHVVHQGGMGDGIVPLCASCSRLPGHFALKAGISIPSANKADTCEKVSQAELRTV